MSAPQNMAQVRIVAEGVLWRVSVGDGRSPPVEGTLPAGVPPLAPPRSRVMVAGSDAAMASAENAFAAALIERLSAAGPAWARLQQLRGRAEAAGQPLVVMLDAEPADAPWELLSVGDGPIEAVGTGVVARWAPGAADARPVCPTAAVWVEGDDPATQRAAAAAHRFVCDGGLELVALDDAPSVLWLVAPGQTAERAREVAVGGGGAGASAVSAALAPALASASLVVVAVCHGGTPTPLATMRWSARSSRPASRSCSRRRRRVPVELLERFAGGMARRCAAVRRSRVVADGRRAVGPGPPAPAGALDRHALPRLFVRRARSGAAPGLLVARHLAARGHAPATGSTPPTPTRAAAATATWLDHLRALAGPRAAAPSPRRCAARRVARPVRERQRPAPSRSRRAPRCRSAADGPHRRAPRRRLRPGRAQRRGSSPRSAAPAWRCAASARRRTRWATRSTARPGSARSTSRCWAAPTTGRRLDVSEGDTIGAPAATPASCSTRARA
ncbi:MAG: hypothetical protein R3F59_19670 [Myxococcota bacterium]